MGTQEGHRGCLGAWDENKRECETVPNTLCCDNQPNYNLIGWTAGIQAEEVNNPISDRQS